MANRAQWFLRDKHCYLFQVIQPLGYRLPLDSQPWAKKEDFPYINPVDPSADFLRPCLVTAIRQTRRKNACISASKAKNERIGIDLTRTALSAEARDGKLYLFMPPLAEVRALFRAGVGD
jgi:uncharacterized protein (DUF2126 family)